MDTEVTPDNPMTDDELRTTIAELQHGQRTLRERAQRADAMEDTERQRIGALQEQIDQLRELLRQRGAADTGNGDTGAAT